MNKILLYVILTTISLIFIFPTITSADNSSEQIVCSGGTVEGITNFSVSLSSVNEDTGQIVTVGTWTLPETAEYVTIKRDYNNYPNSITSGTLVYEGALETFEETITEADIPNNIYYSVWVYDGSAWSTQVNYILEVSNIMGTEGIGNALLLGVFFFGAIGLSISYFVTKSNFLAYIAGFSWLILGAWSYPQHETAWDVNYCVGFFAFWMVLLFILIGAGMYRTYTINKREEAEGKILTPMQQMIVAEEEDERNMNITFGRRSKKKPRNKKKNDKFNQTGEL